VDAKERAIRDLYEARERRDWEAVGALLADEVGWHEPAERITRATSRDAMR
jgi:ketosteroid isomerase-like protein